MKLIKAVEVFIMLLFAAPSIACQNPAEGVLNFV